MWQALKRTCRSQFEAGRDPARVYQLLDDAKASFVRSDYAPEQGLHLEGVFDFIPFRVSGTDPVRLRNKDYLESLLRDNPGNLRLIYHVHAGVIGLEAEQAMRAIARDYDPAKDKPFAVLAALQVSNILQTRGGSMPAQEQARLYKEAGEWLAKALELDPASDRVKRALAQYNQLTKTFTAERAAEAKANADMATQFENLRQRFVNCRGSIERADATAAGHMEKARAALRGGSANMESLRLSKRWQQMAFDSIKLSMTGVEGLIKDLEAFPSRFPNAPKEAKDWIMEARNYLTNKRADYAAMQTAMK